VSSAGGNLSGTETNDLAIGSVIVRGRVEHGQILAGVNPEKAMVYAPVDADAEIGSVFVGGDWIASSISAGAVAGANNFFGDGDDAKMNAMFKDLPQSFSKIGSVTIAGQLLGTVGGTEPYGFAGESIRAAPASRA